MKCEDSTRSVSFQGPHSLTAALNLPSLPEATTSKPLPTSKGRKKRKMSCSPAPETVLYIQPQSGETLRLSPEEAIEASRKLALEDSPVSPSRSPVSELVSRMNAICSETCSEWLTRLDSPSSAWKTSEGCSWVTAQATLMGHSETFSGSWPRAGLLRDGYVYELRTLGPLTGDSDGSASRGGNWLTPNVMDSLDARSLESLNEYQERSRPGRTTAPTLREQVVYGEQWCTPSSENFRTRGGERSDEMGLDNQVKQWPTPQAHDSQGGDAERVGRFGTEHGGRNLNDEVLVEWSSPQARDYRSGTVSRTQDGSSHQSDLNDEVVAWGTPTTRDYKDTGDLTNVPENGLLARQVGTANREQLNPAWEEILMGWNPGWTDASKPCTKKWQSWPAGQGPFQYAYEPPRTVPKGSCPNRVARVKMVGNGVVPQQAEMAYRLLLTQ